MSDDNASIGEVRAKELADHGKGFEKAFEKALEELDGKTYADQTLEVKAFVKISSNPGGVSQYTVTLSPTD
jgi:uncharacterized membrane protein YkoI